MGRRKPYWYLKQQADEAQKREESRRAARVANPKAYHKRPDQSELYYRSLFFNTRIYKVEVNSQTLTLFGGAEAAGLLAAPPSGIVPITARGSGLKPTKFSWYYGDDTPVPRTTSYGTRWVKFYDVNQGQSHRSISVSDTTAVVSLTTIINKFETFFNTTNGTKKALLGARGQATLEVERTRVNN